ncbi:MAG: toxin-antitoxin system HicB family antitoxin [Planctomycetota bacterium]
MAKERKSFLLRVDPKLHDALRRWADDDFRSLNAQVEMLLCQVVQKAGRLKVEENHDEKETSETRETNQSTQAVKPDESD